MKMEILWACNICSDIFVGKHDTHPEIIVNSIDNNGRNSEKGDVDPHRWVSNEYNFINDFKNVCFLRLEDNLK